MKSQEQVEKKWEELYDVLAGNAGKMWQSRTRHEVMLAQKELLEWVLS